MPMFFHFPVTVILGVWKKEMICTAILMLENGNITDVTMQFVDGYCDVIKEYGFPRGWVVRISSVNRGIQNGKGAVPFQDSERCASENHVIISILEIMPFHESHYVIQKTEVHTGKQKHILPRCPVILLTLCFLGHVETSI